MIKLMNSSSVNDLIWSSLFNIYFQYLQVAHFFKFGMITSLIMPKLFLIFLILLIGLCLKWFKIQHWYWYICSMSKEFVFFGYQYRTRFCSLVTVRYHRPFSGFTVQSENIAKCKRSIEDMPALGHMKLTFAGLLTSYLAIRSISLIKLLIHLS